MEKKQITKRPENYTPIPQNFLNNKTMKKNPKNKKKAVKIKFWIKIVSKKQVFMDQYQVMQVIKKVMIIFLKINMMISETL